MDNLEWRIVELEKALVAAEKRIEMLELLTNFTDKKFDSYRESQYQKEEISHRIKMDAIMASMKPPL